jgi:hypothetical protein
MLLSLLIQPHIRPEQLTPLSFHQFLMEHDLPLLDIRSAGRIFAGSCRDVEDISNIFLNVPKDFSDTEIEARIAANDSLSSEMDEQVKEKLNHASRLCTVSSQTRKASTQKILNYAFLFLPVCF